MGKPLVRLYPIDIARLEWLPVAAAPTGVWEKALAEDPHDGSITRYLRVDPGTEIPAFVHDRWEESFVVAGNYKSGDEFYPTGTYLCRPPGMTEGPITTTEGFTSFQTRDINDKLDKPAVRLYPLDIDRIPWHTPHGRESKHAEKPLAADSTGSITRLLRIDPGGDTTELDDHEHNEEVLILEGSCKNGEEFHPAGTYTFNPPHAKHGPFLVDEPLLCFEIKNQP